METNTRYFGTMAYTPEEVITFAEGIFGFEENKQYLLIRFENENNGLLCLQNLEDTHLAFIVANPFVFLPEYHPQPSAADLEKLAPSSDEVLLFYNICVIQEDIERSTMNLRCPVMINGETRKAVQVILEDDRYAFKHPFYELAKES